ncbi:MAG: helicase HerA-like domain-containing protein [Pseudomonadota bacterium]
MDDQNGVFVGGGGVGYGTPQSVRLDKANRHGLIAGATGTGKTVTVQILAEGFSAAGVPVLVPDVKGDLAGIAMSGDPNGPLHGPFQERAETIGLDLVYRACPVTFWDVFGQEGHPVRTTIAEMGPLLLARLLELSEAQEGVLNIAFRVADEQGLPLLDLTDLRALLVWVGENRADLALRYGNVSPASIGAIQRRLLVLDGEGAAALFGEPALELADMMRSTPEGLGYVNVLAANRLMQSPRLYATFLLWLLSELFETLPELGDPEKPVLVVVFDEAHLLFDDAPRALIDKVEQVARLIRSKGVGVYFCTQNPDDVPEDILGQLGNRIQHALRAFTARDRKALRAAAETYRDNPRLDLEAAIREVGTGEAITSFLERKGLPGMAEQTLIRPPASRLGPITAAERAAVMAASPVAGTYDTPIDRDSASEILAARAARAAAEAEAAETRAETGSVAEREFNAARRYSGGRVVRSTARPVRGAARSDSITQAFAKSFARQLGTQSGRAVVRGVLGGLFKGR